MFKYVVSARFLVSFKIVWSSKRCLDDKLGFNKLFLPVLIILEGNIVTYCFLKKYLGYLLKLQSYELSNFAYASLYKVLTA